MARPVVAGATGLVKTALFASSSPLDTSYRSEPPPLGSSGKEAEDACLFSEAEGAPEGRLADEAEEDDESTFKILIATDTHLGFKGEDPVRGNDSFRTFEEILQIGRKESVDFVLHGGDLFDENKPSRTTLYRAMCLLRKYCFGSGTIQFDVLSTVNAAATGDATQPSVNGVTGGAPAAPAGRKEGVRVEAAPPEGQTHTNAEANLAHAATQGMATDVFRFGLNYLNENLAIYGMGWVRDERLHRAYTHVSLVPPQGHEHDCHTELRQSREGRCQVLQPGSSIATSLTAGEAQQKHVFVLETVRPLIVEDVSLADICQGGSGSRRLAPPSAPTDPREAAADREAWGALTSLVEDILRRYSQVAGIDLTASAALPVSQQQQQKPQHQPRRRQAYQLFCNYRAGATQDLASAPAASAGGPLGEAIVARKSAEVLQRLPLVRVRVEHSGFSTISAPRFASQFVGRVANPDSLLCFYKKRQSHFAPSAESSALPDLEFEDVQGAAPSQIHDIIFHYMEGASGLSILSEPDFNDAVQDFAVKMDPSAISNFVASSISAARTHARAELLRRLKADSEAPQSAEDEFTQAARMRRLNVEAFPEAGETTAGEMDAPESFSSDPCGVHGACRDRRKTALAPETRVQAPCATSAAVDLEVLQVSDGEEERQDAATSGVFFGSNTQKAARREATRKRPAGGRGARGRGGPAGQSRRQASADVVGSSDEEATTTAAPKPTRSLASGASGGIKQQKDIRSLLSQLSQSTAGARPGSDPPYVPTQESEGFVASQTQRTSLSESVSALGASRRLLPAKRLLSARPALPLGAPHEAGLSSGANGRALDAAAGALSWTKRAKHNEALVDDEGHEDAASSLLLRGSLCTSVRADVDLEVHRK
ncbi:hypothetical protein Emag_003077 [Eimeria magna]